MEDQNEETDAGNDEGQRRDEPATAGGATMSHGQPGSELIPLEICLQRAAGEYDPDSDYVELAASLLRYLEDEVGVGA